MKQNESEKADAQIDIFKNFSEDFTDEILNKTKFPDGTKITFRPSIYIDISKYMNELEDEDRDTVYSHLMTIHGILVPGSKALEKLSEMGNGNSASIDSLTSGLNRNTNEGKFLSNIFDNVKGLIPADPDQQNMQTIMPNILTAFPKIMGDIQAGVGRKNLNPKKMIGELQGLFGALTANISDEVSKSMGDEDEEEGKEEEKEVPTPKPENKDCPCTKTVPKGKKRNNKKKRKPRVEPVEE